MGFWLWYGLILQLLSILSLLYTAVEYNGFCVDGRLFDYRLTRRSHGVVSGIWDYSITKPATNSHGNTGSLLCLWESDVRLNSRGPALFEILLQYSQHVQCNTLLLLGNGMLDSFIVFFYCYIPYIIYSYLFFS